MEILFHMYWLPWEGDTLRASQPIFAAWLQCYPGKNRTDNYTSKWVWWVDEHCCCTRTQNSSAAIFFHHRMMEIICRGPSPYSFTVWDTLDGYKDMVLPGNVHLINLASWCKTKLVCFWRALQLGCVKGWNATVAYCFEYLCWILFFCLSLVMFNYVWCLEKGHTLVAEHMNSVQKTPGLIFTISSLKILRWKVMW